MLGASYVTSKVYRAAVSPPPTYFMFLSLYSSHNIFYKGCLSLTAQMNFSVTKVNFCHFYCIKLYLLTSNNTGNAWPLTGRRRSYDCMVSLITQNILFAATRAENSACCVMLHVSRCQTGRRQVVVASAAVLRYEMV